jgi:predicted regulator of Ras-like GTPase activity (Roadblock/LC7/MglB family)
MTENDVYTIALQNALDEMRNACPDIQHAFIFKETGEIVAGDAETPQKVIVRVLDAFNGIFNRAEAIGGVEAVTLKCGGGTVALHSFGEHNLVIVTSANADLKYINTLTRVLIPTVLKLLEKISPTPLKNISTPSPPQTPKTTTILTPTPTPPVEEKEALEEPEPAEEPAIQKPVEEELKTEMPSFEVPATQLIVENVGGLLVPSDTVRIDNETLTQWESMFEGKKVEYVEIETFDGKTTKCKVKPIKDSKYFGKGVVQIPEKMQLTLEIKRGELVRVRPVIE